MKLDHKKCRCCCGDNFERCGARPITPFFGKFGLHLNSEFPFRGGRLLNLAPGFKYFKGLINLLPQKLTRNTVEYGACRDCSFIAPWPEFSDDLLLDYYAFYGSESYKRERGYLEPGYCKISQVHGSVDELTMRRQSHELFIIPLLKDIFIKTGMEHISVLDYGGGTGQVAPDQPWIDVDLYDVGDHQVHPLSRNQIDILDKGKESEYSSYDFVQLLHVLEHVGNPSSILNHACSFLKPNGLIYIEVPWEMSDFDRMSMDVKHSCDEHINKFCDVSIISMISGLKLESIICNEGYISLLHVTSPIRVVRCLARKTL